LSTLNMGNANYHRWCKFKWLLPNVLKGDIFTPLMMCKCEGLWFFTCKKIWSHQKRMESVADHGSTSVVC
jgi:hypothetical protein